MIDPVNFKLISYHVEDGAAWICMSPSGKFCTATPELYHELKTALRIADLDPAVDVIILTSKGKAFLAGPDMDRQIQLLEATKTDPHALFDYEDSIPYDVAAGLKKTLIAGVNGIAVAGGLLLVTMTDISIAAESASFGVPEATAGNWEPWIVPMLLSRMSVAKLKYLLNTGRRVPAATAERWGMITEVVPDAELEDRLRAVVKEIKRTVPSARQVYKQMVYQLIQTPVYPLNHNAFAPVRTDMQIESAKRYMDKRKD